MTAPVSTSGRRLLATRNAVAVAFALNGLLFATLVSRLPDVRADLTLSNSALGVLLVAGSCGSVLSLPLSGRIVERFSAAATVRGGAFSVAAGLVLTAIGATVLEQPLLAALGLFAYGAGTSFWDVAINVEGAEVEHRLGRTVMPRFHAAWSVGSIAGSGTGVVMAAWHVPVLAHAALVAAVGLALTVRCSRTFLPVEEADGRPAARGSAWREPRTLLLGLMVLCFALVEGTANDWLSLAVIDGYHQPHWVGVAGFAAFVVAMTAGRLLGPLALDRFGRAPVLWACAAAAAAGSLLTVYGGSLPVMFLGILVWGLGGSLGFPVGMSAAADDPARSAARVAVVATIGYTAFLAGPPALGVLGDAVGTLHALVAVAVLMVPAAVSVLAARPRGS